jgi:hypothetical protein
MEYNRKLINYEEACKRLNLRDKPKYLDHNLSMIEDLRVAHANPAKELIGLLTTWLRLENTVRQLFILDPSEIKEFYEECFIYIVDIDRMYSFEKTRSRTGLMVLNSVEGPEKIGSCWGRCAIL